MAPPKAANARTRLLTGTNRLYAGVQVRARKPAETLNSSQTDIIWDFELGIDKIKVNSNDHGFGLGSEYTITELFDLLTAPSASGSKQGSIAGTLLYNGADDHPVIFIAGQNLTVDQLTAAGSLILA